MRASAAQDAPYPLAEIDQTGLIVAVNRLFLQWVDCAEVDVVGTPLADCLGVNADDFAEALLGDHNTSPILRRARAATGPRYVTVAQTLLPDNTRLIGLVDAARHHSSEMALRAAGTAAEREAMRLQLLLDSAIAFGDAATEDDLGELLAEATRTAFGGIAASVHLIEDGVFSTRGGHNPFETAWPPGAPPQGARTMTDGRVLTISTPTEIDASIPGVDLAKVFDYVGIRAAIIAPILDHGHPFGTVACWFDSDRTFDAQAVPLISAIAQQAAAVLSRLAFERDLRRAAMIDDITGLPNRRLFVTQLERAGRWSRSNSAILFIDLDGFKAVNDAAGHGMGDTLLAEVGRRLRAAQREHDAVARYGGDEFITYIETINIESAKAIAERVRALLAEKYAFLPSHLNITASIGIALHAAGDSETIDQTIRRADHAMYTAKNAGGNAVTTAQSLPGG